MGKLINADNLPDYKYKTSVSDFTKGWNSAIDALIETAPDMTDAVRTLNAATLDTFVQAAYKAGKEGKPLMVALNEVDGK